MIQGSLARRYASALLALAVEKQQVEIIRKELEEFLALLPENPFLLPTLCNQTLPLKERREVLRAITKRLSLSELSANFLMLLIDKQRIGVCAQIGQEFSAMADSQIGLLKAKVKTAKPLSSANQQKIIDELSRLTGKKIQLEVQETPELIGGLVTQLGHTVFDGSLASQLEKMKRQMLQNNLNP